MSPCCKASTHKYGLKIISAHRTFSITCAQRHREQKPFYITTPIFYPNADPHLGHLYSTVLADILARYSLLKTPSRPVVFVTGTDEHGAKIQKAAYMKGYEGREQEFCDKISARFQDLAHRSDLCHSRFVRTTERDHTTAVQYLWRELKSRGFLYKGKHKGWYSVSDECFYTDSQVQSFTHPTHHNTYMISKESRTMVQWTEEENYKFRLSDFLNLLSQRYLTDPSIIIPLEQRDIIKGMLDTHENAADLSVSRPSTRLKWGIPVPDDPGHTIYVWLDALTAYLSAVGYPWKRGDQDGFSCGWPPDVQVIGKDILRFHAIYFPAFLMALDIPLPKTIVSHAHLTVNREKMSKSVGNTADPFAILDCYGADVVRYYLARIGGRYNVDKDWSDVQLLKYQRELFSALGNLLSRSFSPKVVRRLPEQEQYISIKPEIFGKSYSKNFSGTLHSSLENVITKYPVHMDKMEISHALECVMLCLSAANREYTAVAPWLDSTSPTDTSLLLSYIRETLRICGILMQPFIPSKAKAVLDAIGVPSSRRTLSDADFGKGEVPGDILHGVKPVKLFDIIKSEEDTEAKKGWMDPDTL